MSLSSVRSRDAVDVSVVLPCYRAAHLAVNSMRELKEALSKSGARSWEIIVVDDGGGDFPARIPDPTGHARLLRFPRNRGKGAAVKAGMLRATGRVRVYTDIDLPYGSAAVANIANDLWHRGPHLVIGDRSLPTSSFPHHAVPLRRRALSRICSTLVGTLVLGGFPDTQCGLKGIRGDVADLLFPLLRTERFAFDIELLYAATLHGLEIRRVPVQLLHSSPSTVHPVRDSAQVAWDLLRVAWRKRHGWYESAALLHLVHSEADDHGVTRPVPAGGGTRLDGVVHGLRQPPRRVARRSRRMRQGKDGPTSTR